MVRTKLKSARNKSIVYGVTAGVSAFSLLKGQLAWFSHEGWQVILTANPDDKAYAASQREDVEFNPISMQRNISLKDDVVSLWRWVRLLHSQSPRVTNVGTPKAGLLGGLAAWITRVPKRIYVVRGLRLEGVKGPLLPVLWMMERLTTAVATDVVVVSRSLGNELIARRLVDPRKAWLIGSGSSNGVDAEAIIQRGREVSRTELHRELGIETGAFVVGYIGRLASSKGIDTLLEALSWLGAEQSICLLVIGESDGDFDPDRLSEFGNRVKWIGGSTDIAGLLPAIDTLALPTFREGFPNVVLEAAAAGIPAITTKATGAIDSVVDGATGLLFDAGDARGLAAHISRLKTDVSLRKALGTAAQKRALAEFFQERIWDGLASIMHSEPNKDTLRLDSPKARRYVDRRSKTK